MWSSIRNIKYQRVLGVLSGNALMAMGVFFFKLSGMGTDPWSAFVMTFADVLKIEYANLIVMINSVIFLLPLFWGRKYIGVGTIVNWFIVGYMISFCLRIMQGVFPDPASLLERILVLSVGILIISLGVSLYQTSDLGVGPYDSVSLILSEKFSVPYFVCRVTLDALCAGICFLAGGTIGLGTLICALGLGPFVNFFNIYVSEKLIDNKMGETDCVSVGE